MTDELTRAGVPYDARHAPAIVADLIACAVTLRAVGSRLLDRREPPAWQYAVDDLSAAIDRAGRWQRGEPLIDPMESTTETKGARS